MSEDALAESIWATWGASKNLRHDFVWHWMTWNLSRQIKAMRKSRDWSQAELAQKSGLTTQTISRYEKNCRSSTIRNLLRIAAAFDVALVIRFGPFSEALVLMADGALVIPRSFDEELATMALAPAKEDQ